jgi:hypothetical protein
MAVAFPDYHKYSNYQNCESLLKDIWLCYRAAMWKYRKKKLSINETDLLKDRSVGHAIQKVLEQFERDILPCFPEGCEFNIHQDPGEPRYYLAVYKVCKWEPSWAALALKDIFAHLRKNRHHALHNLFLHFIHAFHKATGVGSWWNGDMEYSEEWLEGTLQNELDEVPDPTEKEEFKAHQEGVAQLQKTLFSYRYGQAAEYANKITSTPILTADEIMARLKRIRRDHPAKRIIQAGCHYLIIAPYNMQDFCYGDRLTTDEGDELPYYLQAALIWDWDDFTQQHTEYIDSQANNAGVEEPAASLKIDARVKKWRSLEDFKNSLGWPRALENYFDLANTTAKTINFEPTHRIRVR